MLTKATLFVVGGVFLISLLQFYYLDEPLSLFSLQIYPIQEPMQIYAEEESFAQVFKDFLEPRPRRVHFKGAHSILWNTSYPRQECEPELFPFRHWIGLSREHVPESNQTNHTGQQLYGSVAAQRAIWRHQHPKSCTDKKFIVYEALGPEHGIGTILHTLGVALQAAINLDRILVLNPQPHYEWVNGWFCQNKTTLDECYFEPISSCTVHDAFGNKTANLDNLWRHSELTMESYFRNESDENFSERLFGSSLKEVMMNSDDPANIIQYLRSETPHMFHSLLQAGNLSENSFHWWRAQSMAYIVRPNARLLHELELRRNYFFTKEPLERGTISVHIPYYRHSLKAYPTASHETYLQSAEALVSRHPNELQRRIFLTTEDPDAISFFAKLTNWTVLWTNVTRVPRNPDISDPNVALNNFASRFGWDEEFINSFLNLDVALECDGFVGHLGSHWNRLIDELRSTVRCKYDRVYVDVVQGFNISNYFW